VETVEQATTDARLPVQRIARVPPLALAALSGLLLVLAFPGVDAGWLGWVALVPLLLAIRRGSTRGAFALGWVTGLIWFGGILSWLRLFGEPPFNTILWFLAVAIEASFVALFAGLVRGFQLTDDPRPMPGASRLTAHLSLLAVPSLWTLMEWLRCTGPWGFPWGVLGETQARWLTLIQCADLGGVWLVSFLVAWGNAVIAGLPHRYFEPPQPPNNGGSDTRVSSQRYWGPWGAFLLALLAALLYGAVPRAAPDGPPLRIALVQADNDFGGYLERTRQALGAKPDLVVWPETVMAGDPIRNPATLGVLAGLAREGRCALLAGTPHSDAQGRLKNAAVLVGPDGALAGAYEKVHLVPFGEFIPFRPWIPFLDRFPSVTDMAPGEAYRSLVYGTRGDHSAMPPVGTMICFESAFPEIGRALVRDGAGLLAVLTSDAAYDRTSAPAHHATKAIFRAIETRRPVLQAATTGLTFAVDSHGRVLGRLPMWRPGTLSVAVTPSGATTLYTRLGDWVIVACAGFIAIIVAHQRRMLR
jgi:apolipoprotein N-acyltransferase